MTSSDEIFETLRRFDPDYLGAAIGQRRHAAGIPTEDFARSIGMDLREWDRIESGRSERKISDSQLRLIADRLSVPTQKPSAVPHADNVTRLSIGQRLVSSWKALPGAVQVVTTLMTSITALVVALSASGVLGDAQETVSPLNPSDPPAAAARVDPSADLATADSRVSPDSSAQTEGGSVLEGWSVVTAGSGPTVVPSGQGVTMTIPADARGDGTDQIWNGDNGPDTIAAGLRSGCRVQGDFDLVVAFDLDTWPAANGLRVGLGVDADDAELSTVQRTSLGAGADSAFDVPGGGTDLYVTGIADHGISELIPTQDRRGRLRIVRLGSTVQGYYWHEETWLPIGDEVSFTVGDVEVFLLVWTGDSRFVHNDAIVHFSGMSSNGSDSLC